MAAIKNQVDTLFQNLEFDGLCENPVTGGRFVKGQTGDDSIAHQKREAQKALLAQEWFATYGPSDAPPLPITPLDWEEMRHEFGLNSLIGFYARSLAIRNWHVHEHPLFKDFARGLLAIDTGLWDLQQRVGAAVLKIRPARSLA